MLRPLLAVALAAAAVAGCVAPAAETAAPGSTADALGEASRLVRFGADGALLPLDPAAVVGEAVYRLTGHVGPEPNVGITSTGAIFVSADEEVLRSVDRGETWERVYLFGPDVQGAPADPVSNSDPMLWVDPATDRVYADPMFPALACTTLAWSDDEGATWTERHGTCHPPPMDHQKLGGGPPSAGAPPVAGVLYESVLYHCYNMGVSTNCATSYDGGLSFGPAVPVLDQGRHGCGGLNGMPAVGPDGAVAVGSSEGCDGLYLAVSRDSGVTWSVVEGPKDVGGATNDPDLAFTPDGTLYAIWAGDDQIPYLARTKDLSTWDGPWRVAPPDVRTTVFPVLSAGSDGRLAMSFLGTRDYAGDPSDADDKARWHLYVVTTEDAASGAPTFTARQVTPDDDPVQVGCIWMRGFPGAPCRNLLDFTDSAVAPDGTFFVAYAEGCTEGCAGNADATPEDSRDRQAAIARLDGWSLFASS
ncbi:MAG TPA: sialidase family protein [Candidatus Thermoplasmatota archaeon]|nr:sialidase family protein [Candidatus Thermoplasmatota archaeon]